MKNKKPCGQMSCKRRKNQTKKPPYIGHNCGNVRNVKIIAVLGCIIQVSHIGQYFGMIAHAKNITMTQ